MFPKTPTQNRPFIAMFAHPCGMWKHSTGFHLFKMPVDVLSVQSSFQHAQQRRA